MNAFFSFDGYIVLLSVYTQLSLKIRITKTLKQYALPSKSHDFTFMILDSLLQIRVLFKGLILLQDLVKEHTFEI